MESKRTKTFTKLDMSSLNLAVGQRYESKEELEKILKLLTVRDRFDFDVPISRPDTYIVTCWVHGCRWRVRACRQGQSPEFYIRLYDAEHTCSVTERSNRSRQATADILGTIYRDLIGDIDPSVRPRHVGVAINKHFGIKMEYWKAHRTLKFARELEMGSLERGYEDLPAYLHMIRRANRGTLTRLNVDDSGRFKYLFIAFGASISGFNFMRKVVVVDGTFLHGKYKGTLLTALAQDGNFQIFPLAFGVVDTENDDSWQWFFTQLKLVVPDNNGLALISDRHKSIGKAIRKVYPLAARGICTYHLYKNILVRFRGGNLFRLVKKAANCYRMDEFQSVFDEIETLHPVLHGYLERADVRMWARVHFPGDRYNLTTTNIAESMNKVLAKTRSFPIVRILEEIRLMMTRWFNDRREDALAMKTTLTRGVEKLLEDRVSGAKQATVQTIDSRHIQVICGSSLHVVNLDSKRCTCRRFDIDKLPCVHAIAAAEHKNVSRVSLCHPYYFSQFLGNAYAGSVMPNDFAVPVPDDVGIQVCTPPIPRNQPGRPKISRMKSCLEVASEKKRRRKQHTCSLCKKEGHNAKTCINH
ncbi:Protein FAR1-RELATED SEQUENCE 6 [Cardamine amara subsp. amara]|uniref:Protein FAR1-RELATED SEQUENCE 6 n=2 Tax=Cardamine amara subsp. amara TaxID=228776 RepID=A0ABD0Z817_CARAN